MNVPKSILKKSGKQFSTPAPTDLSVTDFSSGRESWICKNASISTEGQRIRANFPASIGKKGQLSVLDIYPAKNLLGSFTGRREKRLPEVSEYAYFQYKKVQKEVPNEDADLHLREEVIKGVIDEIVDVVLEKKKQYEFADVNKLPKKGEKFVLFRDEPLGLRALLTERFYYPNRSDSEEENYQNQTFEVGQQPATTEFNPPSSISSTHSLSSVAQ